MLGTTTVEGNGKPFYVCRNFGVYLNKGASPNIPWVGYVDPTFQQMFRRKVESLPQGDVVLSYHLLQKSLTDNLIIKELGDMIETNLWMIWELLKRQFGGEPGILLTNNHENIFYVCDVEKMLWVVCVRWIIRRDHWSVYVSSADCFTWPVGSQVISLTQAV
jgi:hypothetical protein